MRKISIVVPVYNVEEYIRECIESIMRQKYDNYELILVDDGSKDKSGNVCDEYKSDKVIVIHKENAGVSSARNVGIKKSTGDYIMFMDADDFLANDMCLNILNDSLRNNPDVLLYKMKYYYDKIDKYILLPDYPNLNYDNKFETLYNLIKYNKLSISPCDKIIKASILKNSDILFDETLKHLEDADWSLRLYNYIDTIDIINSDIYVYRQQRNGSASTTYNFQLIEDFKRFIEMWANKVLPEKSKKLVLNYVSYQYVILLAVLNHSRLYKNEIQFINKYRYLLKYNICKKVKLTQICYKFFGLGITSQFLKIYLCQRNKGTLRF